MLPKRIADLRNQMTNLKAGGVVKLEEGETMQEVTALIGPDPELKPFTITSTVKIEATDTRAAILKASQLLASAANGTPYEFDELSVKVE